MRICGNFIVYSAFLAKLMEIENRSIICIHSTLLVMATNIINVHIARFITSFVFTNYKIMVINSTSR